MVMTIEQALHPLLLTFSLLGCGVYFPKKIHLNIFYDLTIWVVYVCLYYYLVIELKIERFYFEPANIITVLMSIFVIIISVIINIYHNKRFRIFIKRLAAVDNTLEKLGTPKVYHKLHTLVKWVLIGWLVSINFMNINDLIWLRVKKNPWRLILPYITNYHFHVNMFMDLLQTTLLWYIGSRFDKVNEHMRCLLLKEEYGLRCTWKKPILIHKNSMCTSYYKCAMDINVNRHLHLELCQIARELNRIFKIQMTMEMINCMICFLRYFWYIYIHIEVKFPFSLFSWYHMQTWLLFFAIRLFCLNYACESVSNKANEMKTIIHQVSDFLRYADVRNEIFQFTLQLIYHPLKFTGIGVFYFGNDILRKFIISLIAIVIVIIQVVTIPEGMYRHFREKNITSTSR